MGVVTCRPDDGQVVCWQRMRDVREGNMARAHTGAWRWRHPVNHKWERVLRCPYCGGTLPTIEAVLGQMLMHPEVSEEDE